jgi:hypothetical protein
LGSHSVSTVCRRLVSLAVTLQVACFVFPAYGAPYYDGIAFEFSAIQNEQQALSQQQDPVLGALESAIERNPSRWALPASELKPFTPEYVAAAIVSELTHQVPGTHLSRSRRFYLEKAFVQLQKFVPDREANIVMAYQDSLSSGPAIDPEDEKLAKRVLAKIQSGKAIAWKAIIAFYLGPVVEGIDYYSHYIALYLGIFGALFVIHFPQLIRRDRKNILSRFDTACIASLCIAGMGTALSSWYLHEIRDFWPIQARYVTAYAFLISLATFVCARQTIKLARRYQPRADNWMGGSVE